MAGAIINDTQWFKRRIDVSDYRLDTQIQIGTWLTNRIRHMIPHHFRTTILYNNKSSLPQKIPNFFLHFLSAFTPISLTLLQNKTRVQERMFFIIIDFLGLYGFDQV